MIFLFKLYTPASINLYLILEIMYTEYYGVYVKSWQFMDLIL